ncbi:ROK family protein [Synergistales bacterium]|nr:ROK family protein [Synergistales bacterium]
MKAIGVDLGGHKIAVGLVEDGRITARTEERTEPTREPEPVVAQIVRMAKAFGAGAPMGVCIPGGLDATRERALMISNFAGWNGLPIRRMFESVLGAPVVVENDANAYALGERLAGVARGMSDYIVITLGTGIGGGIVSGGRLLTGAHGMAGEVGHIVLGSDEPCGPGCGGLGHFEAMCGADALEKRALKIGCSDADISLKDLWARREEEKISPLWDFALETISRGIASLVHVFDPEAVIIGGGMRNGEGFMENLGERVPKYLGLPFREGFRLLSSSLGTDAPIFGGAAVVSAAIENRA